MTFYRQLPFLEVDCVLVANVLNETHLWQPIDTGFREKSMQHVFRISVPHVLIRFGRRDGIRKNPLN
jgi:hypothetical protein